MQHWLGGPFVTSFWTVIGVFGSICTLAASDTGISHHTVTILITIGAIIGILGNLISSLGAHLTPTPATPEMAKAKQAVLTAHKAASDAHEKANTARRAAGVGIPDQVNGDAAAVAPQPVLDQLTAAVAEETRLISALKEAKQAVEKARPHPIHVMHVPAPGIP